MQRALKPAADMKSLLVSVDSITKVDDLTVHFKTKGPNALLLNNLTNLFIMNKAWSEANNAADPQNLKEKVATEPTKIQTFAKDEKKGVETGLKQEEQKSKAAMKAKRKKEMDGAQQEQVKAKSAMELKREAVTTWINTRYDKAKTFVDTTLKNLETQSLAAFDAGQKALSTQFERNVKRRINAWKDDRYSGLFGGVKWLRDKLFGIDKFPEVKQIFTDERAAGQRADS